MAEAPAFPQVRPLRRVVTGHDERGGSVILSDGPSPHVMTRMGIATYGLTEVWRTTSTPADTADGEDHCTIPPELAPPPGGTVLRVVQFPPDDEWMGRVGRERLADALGESGRAAFSGDAEQVNMHRTPTVDYAIVLSGEIHAVMDEGETRLEAGDVLVQRGTNHGWSNRSTAVCVVAFVLIDAAG